MRIRRIMDHQLNLTMESADSSWRNHSRQKHWYSDRSDKGLDCTIIYSTILQSPTQPDQEVAGIQITTRYWQWEKGQLHPSCLDHRTSTFISSAGKQNGNKFLCMFSWEISQKKHIYKLLSRIPQGKFWFQAMLFILGGTTTDTSVKLRLSFDDVLVSFFKSVPRPSVLALSVLVGTPTFQD